MRTHGWGGDPPDSDEEAIRRILDTARRCIDQRGASTTIVDVAQELSITRQTVYRYVVSTEALLWQVGLDAVAEYFDQLAAHLRGVTDPAEAVVEAVAYTVERLPNEPYLGVALAAGRRSALAQGVTSDIGLTLARKSVSLWDVDWDAAGIDERQLDDVIEWMNRALQSLLLEPGRPTRTGKELRRFVAGWIGPAIRTATDQQSEDRR